MDDGHIIDDPLMVVGVKPDFTNLGLEKKLENAIIIGGTVYELVDDNRPNECVYCDLINCCQKFSDCICAIIFDYDDVVGKRFKERTDL